MSLATVSSRQTPARDAAISRKSRMLGAMIASYTKIKLCGAFIAPCRLSHHNPRSLPSEVFACVKRKKGPLTSLPATLSPEGRGLSLPKRGYKLQHRGSRRGAPSPLWGEGWGEGS